MTQLIVWLNAAGNACASVLLAPLAVLPGWLSATLVAAVTGVLLLIVFKYTSNQQAIKRARATIKANLLALSLFKESAAVSLRSQGRLLAGVAALLGLSVVPMLVMLVPMGLVVGQLALWYQARPLHVGEEVIVTLKVADGDMHPLPDLRLAASDNFDVAVGPIRVPKQNAMYWNLQAKQPGAHRLTFDLGQQHYEKEFAVGDGFMPVSLERPAWDWEQAMFHPREAPFAADSPVQGIKIDYPQRPILMFGISTWIVYWFVASMVAAFIAKPFLKVNF